ncbi:hypothetical protein E8E13_011549 [Curvularia kusanoi]|uniref:Uncharacterized protein n=1 Tax=Curvularia kusanoi TaxID=90978 RepID=A0A9P4TQX1_CURKU|nr:hypothetical protein E8E13_011549 [Curvularia kusanoi]
MNAVQVESPSSRRRTQAFIATSSPDELYGKIISALGPKQTSHSDSNGGNAQGSQTSSGTAVPDAPATTSAPPTVSTQAPTSLAPIYVTHNLEETNLDRTHDRPEDSAAAVVPTPSQRSSLKKSAHTNPNKQVHFSQAATEVTSEDPNVASTAISHESPAVPTPPQQINTIMGSVRLGQNKHIRFLEGTTNPTSSTLQSPDTQDTQDSTQQSEVFSPSGSFADFTPPTQESLDDTVSQIDTPGFSQEISASSEGLEPASSKTPQPSSSKKADAASSEEALTSQEQSSANIPTPVLRKRAHDASEASDDVPQPKRSKLSKQSIRSKNSKLPRHSMRLRSAR